MVTVAFARATIISVVRIRLSIFFPSLFRLIGVAPGILATSPFRAVRGNCEFPAERLSDVRCGFVHFIVRLAAVGSPNSLRRSQITTFHRFVEFFLARFGEAVDPALKGLREMRCPKSGLGRLLVLGVVGLP
ncbi:hypothetical protein [Mycobacteroides abscessus]|uniref:hypothetical protein n=1 Tax=Mycobacteroides abscessus TaxID=36809 RepID=UPI000C257454|nr:hypothetical protein [Mycobacteroides abscessus]RIT73911.1 hypothetical protein D2E82_23390 [Mycobacteroides abscessus]